MPKRPNNAEEPVQDRATVLRQLQEAGAGYLLLKAEEKVLKAKLEKAKLILDGMMAKAPLVVNGEHKEILIPTFDGKTSILFRDQVAQKVTVVDNAIDILRTKLESSVVDQFVTIKYELHPNALDNLVKQGLIDALDLEDLVVTKVTHSLIVKVA